MDFSSALIELKSGKKILRSCWNGKGFLNDFCYLDLVLSEGGDFIGFFDEHGFVCRWAPINFEILADDWILWEE